MYHFAAGLPWHQLTVKQSNNDYLYTLSLFILEPAVSFLLRSYEQIDGICAVEMGGSLLMAKSFPDGTRSLLPILRRCRKENGYHRYSGDAGRSSSMERGECEFEVTHT